MSMMSTVGIELNNYKNPGWSWNAVTKGYRSASRRTRKSVARNWIMSVGLADISAGKVDGVLVSDTEKLGVTVLGQRFGDKVEDVPVEKRKIIFHSPSPAHNIGHVSNQLSSGNSRGKRRCRTLHGSIATRNSSIVDCKVLGVNEQKYVYCDDFSGIEILAAVACSDGMGVNDDNGEHKSVEGLTREQIELSIATVPLEETIASSEIINTSSKGTLGKDFVERSSFQDDSILQKYHDASDDMSTNQPLPVQRHWSHWDLNVVMDALEQPCDVMSDDLQKNALASISVDGDGGIQFAGVDGGREPEDTKDDLLTRHSESDDQKLCVEGQEPEMHLGGNANQFADTLDDLDCSTESFYSIEASAQAMNDGKSFDIYVNNSSQVVNKGSLAISPARNTVYQMSGSCALDGDIFCADSVQPNPSDVVSCPVQVVDSVCCAIDKNILDEEGEKSGGESGMHIDDTKNSRERSGSVGIRTSVRPEGAGDSCGSPVCENIHASSASAVSIAEINSPVHAESGEMLEKSCEVFVAIVDEYGNDPSSGLCKVGKGDPSDVSQDDMVHNTGKENSKVLQAGYDSQFEDGELREEDLNYWEENEGRDKEEVEHVDYGSEFEEDRFYVMEVENSHKKMKVETGPCPTNDEVIKHIEHCAKGDDSRENPLSMDKRIAEVSGGFKTGEHMDDCLDKHDVKDFHSRVAKFMLCKRELLSRTEGPLSSDTSHRKNPVFFPRSREACVDKFKGNRHGRSPVCSNFPNNFPNSSGGYWESKHRQSPTYCGSYALGCPRRRSIVESCVYRKISDDVVLEEPGESGFENRTRRQSWNSSNGEYRCVIRRPLAGRDVYDADRGMAHVRDTGPKKRLRRYPQGIRRGIQEDYHRSMPDDSTEYPNHMPHRFSRRDRSSSHLIRGRLHNFSYKKSRSISRSRTPSEWFSLRSNDRVDRVRLPFQKRFAAAYEEGFMSSPRGHVSFQHDSKWFDDRNDALDPFWGRKSTPRAFGQSQRFDSVRVARRLNSDECFRPAIRPRRFSDIPRAASGCKYEGRDGDRKKRIKRYEEMN